MRESIEWVCARLAYLPPYSPDLKPIENAFAKLKVLLPKAAASTIPKVCHAIADALPQSGFTETASYFTAAGYEVEYAEML